jgi:cupin fold WbuC family metalloprotein
MNVSNSIRNFNQVSEEILYPIKADVVSISKKEVKQLIKESESTLRKRMRFCNHQSPSDGLHEMLIVHEKGTYVRPHKHLGRSESFHIIQGRTDVIVYEDNGKIREVVQMGDFNSEYNFYYRLNESLFHTMIIYSDHLVFQETTSGPFDPGKTEFAPWSPLPENLDSVEEFMKKIMEDAALSVAAISKQQN